MVEGCLRRDWLPELVRRHSRNLFSGMANSQLPRPMVRMWVLHSSEGL